MTTTVCLETAILNFLQAFTWQMLSQTALILRIVFLRKELTFVKEPGLCQFFHHLPAWPLLSRYPLQGPVPIRGRAPEIQKCVFSTAS